MNKQEFFRSIFESQKSTTVGTFVTAFTDKKNLESIDLKMILNLDETRFSEEALLILDLLENDKELPYQEQFSQLKWKLISLINIQDSFEGIIYDDNNLETFTGKSYFYYEGLHLIREYFYCGFNNYLSASSHLLRTFIEFNIKQNYYDFICQERHSFLPLTKYFKDGFSPNNLKMVNTYLPSNSFTKPIKKKIQLILKGISNTSSHAYKPIDSNRGEGSLHHQYSIDSLYFWLELNSTINVVLWSYYIVHPTLFNPKDVYKKFGFNYPMGAFISAYQYSAIKNSLSEDDLKLFRNYALNSDKIKDLNFFYDSQEDLSDDEIWETWTDKKRPDSIEMGYIQTVAKYRAMTELLASKCIFDAQKEVDETLEPLIKDLGSYSWWKSNYKKF